MLTPVLDLVRGDVIPNSGRGTYVVAGRPGVNLFCGDVEIPVFNIRTVSRIFLPLGHEVDVLGKRCTVCAGRADLRASFVGHKCNA